MDDDVEPLCKLSELTLDELINECKDTCGVPKVGKARIIVCENSKGGLKLSTADVARKGFIDNPTTLKCYRINFTPYGSEPGLYRISKVDCTADFANNKHFEKSAAMRSSHVHPATNPTVDVMPGINTSMHYMGGVNSAGEMHREDGKLAAVAETHCSLVPDSDAPPFKQWLMVPDSQKLEEAIRKAADAAPSSSEDSSPSRSGKREKEESSLPEGQKAQVNDLVDCVICLPCFD
ncbi:hypothetical protein QAD02_005487 [Eretmocerus hayati]|uniref:Uncharacterized protein n=1 Tax=Eretmocerus hayati TaxID=131215 RepID=A0ACC2NSP0_9HYME|nr:hypothetical protein QAD02_005487 [Eretmocerus hayati]